MENQGIIIFLLGVSGSGKTTIVNKLITENPEKYMLIQSYTTRPPRMWEKPGEKYFFVSPEEFEKSIENNEFIEYAFVHHSYYYGTKRQSLIDAIKQQKIAFKEIDTEWLSILKKQNLSEMSYKSIFLNLDKETMIHRITNRAPISEEELAHRIESSSKELIQANQICDIIIDGSGNIEEITKIVAETIENLIKKNLTE